LTTITLIGPWQFALPLFCLSLTVFRPQILQVTAFMNTHGQPESVGYMSPSIKLHVWLHAVALTIIVMLSSVEKLFECAVGLLFTLYIFRLNLIDSLAGWLPREWTWALLAAGLSVAAAKGLFLINAGAAVGFLIAGFSIRILGGYLARREVLGLGDIWLMAGLGAWFGFSLALSSLLLALTGFILWYSSHHQRSLGGPLGPWLGYSALFSMAVTISDPFLMW